MTDASTLDPNMRRRRLIDLVLMLVVAFSQSVFGSIYLLLSHVHIFRESSDVTNWLIDSLLRHVIGLALLVYLLKRQGRGLSDIGFRFEWKDIPRTILLIIVSYVCYSLFARALYWLFVASGNHVTAPTNIEFLYYSRQGWNPVLAIPVVLINPFYEELIVRAYLMTEIKYLTGRTWLAVLVSVTLQISYHLYQGLFSALSFIGLFTIYALYYARAKRIVPVIFAHMVQDIAAFARV